MASTASRFWQTPLQSSLKRFTAAFKGFDKAYIAVVLYASRCLLAALFLFTCCGHNPPSEARSQCRASPRPPQAKRRRLMTASSSPRGALCARGLIGIGETDAKWLHRFTVVW